MSCLLVSTCFLAVSLLVAPILATVCPDGCICTNTRDGLHRATCSNLAQLHKFTMRQKHHNINILDLSHNNITKLSHELDRLTEIVTLDLSTNGITDLSKFLRNAKKLVHLNLASNRIEKLSLTQLPASVSSLDLTNNLLHDVPSDFEHLRGLEHLEIEGNPLHCSCENIRQRDRLLARNVFIDKVKCASPSKYVGRSWLELKTKEVCWMSPRDNFDDMMMGDQPLDAEKIGEESTALKSMSMVENNGLLDSHFIHREKVVEEDDDSLLFMKVNNRALGSSLRNIEGSGDDESSTSIYDTTEIYPATINANLLATEENNFALTFNSSDDVTDGPIEGSGEGSGFGVLETEPEVLPETTTPFLPEFNPSPVHRIFDEDEVDVTEFPPVATPNIYEGGQDWHSRTDSPSTDSPRIATPMMTPDTTVSETLSSTKEIAANKAVNDQPSPHKTGTYVCIAIIVILLVGLIGFAIIKGQIRKRRDRRLLRQQKRDIEKASKEMVDMNKSLLGKPATADSPEKKLNGRYELVPTHEPLLKKSENSGLNANGIRHADDNSLRTNSPRDTNQNKSSSKDNNLADITPQVQDTSFESEAASPDSKKHSMSLSSEDIFVPMHDELMPSTNGIDNSDISQPLKNGNLNSDSDLLSPAQYVPVYSPDMGRVRIKMAEIPKPKTPVLVTRSRSNAGDIIITPSLDVNVRTSAT